ncbi:MAG: hypothetical protein CVU56_27775 [Deltaproteobacteria bacterium HGW-Deltaproteobacteria-14]|nr:MAG: hypothetical protein CVU56_27775 [Deltaproteobacteria bacterium HGW-Deltaproteobacteria-14]
MLFDGAFADRVYADPEATLSGLALTAVERGWLVGPDRRAYGVDPLRRHRSLQALLEEHPVSAAALAAAGVAVRSHDAFFSGPRFHGAVQARGSLAAAFGEHLAAAARVPLQRGVIALERAMAEARRGVAAPWADGAALRLVGTARVVACPHGTLEAYGVIRAALERGGRSPLETLLAGPVRLPRTPVDPGQAEHVLVEATAGQGDAGAALSFASDELATLLTAARPGATREALLATLGDLGLDAAEGAELLDELVADGLLERAG